MPRPRETNRTQHERICRRVRERRLALGWTQDRLAAKLGTQAATLSKWEAGRVPLTISRLVEVGRALGVSVTDLIDDVRDNPADGDLGADRVPGFHELAPEDRRVVLALVERLRPRRP